MCTHNANGHGVGCQAIHAIYQIQARTMQIFHPLTYLREARFAHQLDNLVLWCAVLKELHINTTNA